MEANETGQLLEYLSKRAVELGSNRAVAIPAWQVVVDDRVRFKCLVPLCANYGVNLMCPPNIISVDEFRNVLASYKFALLIQVTAAAGQPPEELTGQENLADAWAASQHNTEGEANPARGYLRELKTSQEKVYDILAQLESECAARGFPLAAGLAAGGCHLCSECVGPGSACLHPFRARPAAEGLGVNVIATARLAGIDLDFSGNAPVSWLAVLLVG